MRCPAAGALYPGVWARTGLIVVNAGEPIDAMTVGSPAAIRDRRLPLLPLRSIPFSDEHQLHTAHCAAQRPGSIVSVEVAGG